MMVKFSRFIGQSRRLENHFTSNSNHPGCYFVFGEIKPHLTLVSYQFELISRSTAIILSELKHRSVFEAEQLHFAVTTKYKSINQKNMEVSQVP